MALGVEYNPRADEVGPLANWLVMTETRRRPALMFGLSSDRIGTPDGEAYFFTLSKDLQGLTGWPVAPYVGAAYGTFEDDLRAVGGFRARLGRGFASTLIHDGKATHLTLESRFLGRHVLAFLWVDTEHLGVSYSVAF